MIVWPEVSIKPPALLLELESNWAALMVVWLSKLVKIEKGNVPFLASLPIKILPPWVYPFAVIVEFAISVLWVADKPMLPPRPDEPFVCIRELLK